MKKKRESATNKIALKRTVDRGQSKPEPNLQPREDETLESVDASVYRILPYPTQAALVQFGLLQIKPPAFEQVFMSMAIGPNTGDIHALACIGIFPIKDSPDPKKPERGVEILNAFAVSDDAYIAICEAIRALMIPFGYRVFEGDVNMLSVTQPYRVVESKPFYRHVDPSMRTM